MDRDSTKKIANLKRYVLTNAPEYYHSFRDNVAERLQTQKIVIIRNLNETFKAANVFLDECIKRSENLAVDHEYLQIALKCSSATHINPWRIQAKLDNMKSNQAKIKSLIAELKGIEYGAVYNTYTEREIFEVLKYHTHHMYDKAIQSKFLIEQSEWCKKCAELTIDIIQLKIEQAR